ncbi:MAG: NAD(P)-binding domain-containing protein [Deltaproteobacteria bacterium]|nr:NAD(P)-binding domain-containing protein [Deltaproteobacteria bacterium]
MEDVLPYVTLGVVALVALVFVGLRRQRERRDTERHRLARQEGLHVPTSLHPVIDTDLCIGSLACVRSCPEGDILGIVNGAGALVAGANCIGHGRCAAECPVDAIKLVFGSSERGIDLPEVDETFESSRPGVHIVGELSGMGLIKNAMTQGLELGEYLGRTLEQSHGELDVVIVGAGPAGLATGLALRAAGVSFEILEQDSLGGTVASYPRQKVVMTERVLLPIHGEFGKSSISKEELIAEFERMRARAELPVQTGVKVTAVNGADRNFTVRTSSGDRRAKKVVLATGRRGSPRKLGVKGEDSAHVTYRLIDPEQYTGESVLVVGGGDSAIEAALALAEAGATVAISYRGPAFARCRAENRDKISRAIEQGQVKAILSSEVVEIRGELSDRSKGPSLDQRGARSLGRECDLDVGGQRVTLPASYVIVSIGGELPTEFLQTLGIGVRRFSGEERKSAASNKVVGIGRRTRRSDQEEGRRRELLGVGLFGLGLIILAALAFVGGDYYWLSQEAREQHPQHDFLRSSGLWGHGVGIAATIFMMSNFLYAMRKRIRALRGLGRIKTWLTFHVFVGTMSPLVIAFHAAFESKNQLATATAASLAIVAVTGLIGRYLYALLPSREGKLVDLSELRARYALLRAEISEEARARVGRVADRIVAEPPRRGAVLEVLRSPIDGLRLRAARAAHPDFVDFEVWEALAEAQTLRVSVAFYRGLRRALGAWRVLHVVLAVFLVFAIAVHVAISIYLGYAWILTP